MGRCHFGVKLTDGEQSTIRDFRNNLLVLYTRTEDECLVWVAALHQAAERKLEDDYDVMHVIGEGGFAKVRLGRCRKSGELRAIKTMFKSDASAKVFGTEIAIIKRVNHPNIVKTYDVFDTPARVHIVMEYMQGGMLYDAIEDGVQFDEVDVAQFMRELLDGVLYLHSMGIVHRDIKPENVLCTSRETPLHVKIADFGLSSISSLSELNTNRMLMSTMIGTPEFVAPEIARQQTYTEKVDMWALGMLCYNVIARKLPLNEDMDMIAQIQKGIKLTFPEPEWRHFSPASRSFIRSLICEEAQKRLCPLGSLVHPWLQTTCLYASTKFATHGRMSTMLFIKEKMPKSVSFRPHQKGGNSTFNSSGTNYLYRRRTGGINPRKEWKKAFNFVVAVRRLANNYLLVTGQNSTRPAVEVLENSESTDIECVQAMERSVGSFANTDKTTSHASSGLFANNSSNQVYSHAKESQIVGSDNSDDEDDDAEESTESMRRKGVAFTSPRKMHSINVDCDVPAHDLDMDFGLGDLTVDNEDEEFGVADVAVPKSLGFFPSFMRRSPMGLDSSGAPSTARGIPRIQTLTGKALALPRQRSLRREGKEGSLKKAGRGTDAETGRGLPQALSFATPRMNREDSRPQEKKGSLKKKILSTLNRDPNKGSYSSFSNIKMKMLNKLGDGRNKSGGDALDDDDFDKGFGQDDFGAVYVDDHEYLQNVDMLSMDDSNNVKVGQTAGKGPLQGSGKKASSAASSSEHKTWLKAPRRGPEAGMDMTMSPVTPATEAEKGRSVPFRK